MELVDTLVSKTSFLTVRFRQWVILKQGRSFNWLKLWSSKPILWVQVLPPLWFFKLHEIKSLSSLVVRVLDWKSKYGGSIPPLGKPWNTTEKAISVFFGISVKKKTKSKFCSENLVGLILAQNERWNRALHMRVERSKESSERVSNTVELAQKSGIKYWILSL